MSNQFFCSVGDRVKITLLENNDNLLTDTAESFTLRVSATVTNLRNNSLICFFDIPEDFKDYVFVCNASDIRLVTNDKGENHLEFFPEVDADLEEVKVNVEIVSARIA